LVLVAEAEDQEDHGHRSVTGWDSSVQKRGHLSNDFLKKKYGQIATNDESFEAPTIL